MDMHMVARATAALGNKGNRWTSTTLKTKATIHLVRDWTFPMLKRAHGRRRTRGREQQETSTIDEHELERKRRRSNERERAGGAHVRAMTRTMWLLPPLRFHMHS